MGSAPHTESPLYSLCLVLLQTFSALGLGYLCVRAKFIDDSGKGDLGGLRFYVNWIGLPLVVFDKLATACLGDINWIVVLACSLAKFVIFALTFLMTFFGYRTSRGNGERILTATTFSFFAVASNDLAVGFPVIHAMYGPSMEVYISANVFVFQVFFQPLCMVLLELGTAWRLQEGSGGGGVLVNAGKRIMQNVVILATLAGLLYQLLLGHSGLLAPTVEVSDGKAYFPHPLEDLVNLWTAPFTFLFLFINGTSLTQASLDRWSSLLVLMKVVACAYLSFFLGSALLPSGESNLRNFTFFYGSIPTGAAPLVFATQYAPSSVGIVASASLYCLILAGPIEILTALFLEQSDVNMLTVLQAQQGVAILSAGVSGAVLVLLLLTLRHPAAPRRVISGYTAAVFVYDLITVLMHRVGPDCGKFAWQKLFGFFQMSCCLLVLYAQLQLSLGCIPHFGHYLILAGVALALALCLPYFNTLDDLCQGPPNASLVGLILLLMLNGVLLLASVGLTIRGVVLKRRERAARAAATVSLEGCVGVERLTDSMSPSSARASQVRRTISSISYGGESLIKALAMLQVMRLVMEVTNILIKIVGSVREPSHTTPGFTPMFMLVNVLEHGQGAILFVVAIFEGTLGTLVQALFGSCRMRPSPELPVSSLEDNSRHSFMGSFMSPGGMSLQTRRPSWPDT